MNLHNSILNLQNSKDEFKAVGVIQEVKGPLAGDIVSANFPPYSVIFTRVLLPLNKLSEIMKITPKAFESYTKSIMITSEEGETLSLGNVMVIGYTHTEDTSGDLCVWEDVHMLTMNCNKSSERYNDT